MILAFFMLFAGGMLIGGAWSFYRSKKPWWAYLGLLLDDGAGSGDVELDARRDLPPAQDGGGGGEVRDARVGAADEVGFLYFYFA